MGIVDGIKDTARKATNSVVDTAEEMIGKPKSPQELAKRLVEHLTHQEYTKIAEIITEEAKKYIAKMGLDDIAPVNKKLEEFESSMNNVAKGFEEGDYQQVASKLKEVERSIPEQMGEVSEVFKTIKGFLKSVIKTVEEYSKEGEKGLAKNGPDFSKLQTIFEEYFNKLTTK